MIDFLDRRDGLREMLLNRGLLRGPRISTRMASRISRVGLQKRFFRYDGIPVRASLAAEGYDDCELMLTSRKNWNRNGCYYQRCHRESRRFELVPKSTTTRNIS